MGEVGGTGSEILVRILGNQFSDQFSDQLSDVDDILKLNIQTEYLISDLHEPGDYHVIYDLHEATYWTNIADNHKVLFKLLLNSLENGVRASVGRQQAKCFL